MGFRDQSQAQRAHIEALEGDLAAAEDQISQLEADRAELPELRERMAALEEELRKYRPSPRPAASKTLRLRLGLVALAGVAAIGGGIALTSPDVLRQTAGPPPLGMVDLDLEPHLAGFSGSVQSTRPAESVAPGCPGHIAQQPTLQLRTGTRRDAEIWADSDTDLVLVVRSASGQIFCDSGTNPRLRVDLEPGLHDVWVGTYPSGGATAFTLDVDAQTAEESGAFDAPAELSAPLDPSAPWRHTAMASGDVRAELARTGCLGLVPRQPQYELDVQSPGTLELTALGPGGDLVLLVERPDGSFNCDDDSAGGFDPAIVEPGQPGTYRVWVGTYTGQETTPFTFTASLSTGSEEAASPARLGRWELSGGGTLSFSERATGAQTLRARSGTAPSTAPAGCLDLYGGAVPEVEFSLDRGQRVSLSLNSESPLGFWVEHADGSIGCHPTGHAENAVWLPGVHRVWVGANEPDSGVSYHLTVEAERP